MTAPRWTVSCESCGSRYSGRSETRPECCGACGSEFVLTGRSPMGSGPGGTTPGCAYCSHGSTPDDSRACDSCAMETGEPAEPEPVSDATGTCRYCGNDFAGDGEDCGGCPLNEADAEDYSRRKAGVPAIERTATAEDRARGFRLGPPSAFRAETDPSERALNGGGR